MKIWQVASGEPHRYFEEIFFKYGVMILGPSYLGNALTTSYASGSGSTKGNQVNNFANLVKEGDRIVIRKRNQIAGFGEIHKGSSYKFIEQFGCILGWDLCHSWEVSWNNDEKIINAAPNIYKDIKQFPSFTGVLDKNLVDYVINLDTNIFKKVDQRIEQNLAQKLSYDDLRIRLFQRGVSSLLIENIVNALRQCRQLSEWYYANEHSDDRPTEHEVVSHMVLPLLLSLGWSHQQIAVEWKKVDVALFLRTPTNPENCVAIIEAKGLGNSLGDVLTQAQNYVKKLSLKKVRKIIITDGPNIFLHRMKEDGSEFNPEPYAYLNVTYLTDKYILPKNTSAIETLIELLPSQF